MSCRHCGWRRQRGRQLRSERAGLQMALRQMRPLRLFHLLHLRQRGSNYDGITRRRLPSCPRCAKIV